MACLCAGCSPELVGITTNWHGGEAARGTRGTASPMNGPECHQDDGGEGGHSLHHKVGEVSHPQQPIPTHYQHLQGLVHTHPTFRQEANTHWVLQMTHASSPGVLQKKMLAAWDDGGETWPWSTPHQTCLLHLHRQQGEMMAPPSSTCPTPVQQHQHKGANRWGAACVNTSQEPAVGPGG